MLKNSDDPADIKVFSSIEPEDIPDGFKQLVSEIELMEAGEEVIEKTESLDQQKLDKEKELELLNNKIVEVLEELDEIVNDIEIHKFRMPPVQELGSLQQKLRTSNSDITAILKIICERFNDALESTSLLPEDADYASSSDETKVDSNPFPNGISDDAKQGLRDIFGVIDSIKSWKSALEKENRDLRQSSLGSEPEASSRQRRRSIVDSSNKTNRELNTELSDLRSNLEVRNREIEVLKWQLEAASNTTELSELRSKLEEQERLLSDEIKNRRILEDSKTSNTSAVKVLLLEQQNQSQTKQIGELTTQKKQLEATLASNSELIVSLKEQISDGPKQLAALQEQLDSEKSRATTESSLREKAEKDKDVALAKADAIRSDLEIKLEAALKEKDNTKAESSVVRAENSQLVTELDKAIREGSELREKNKLLQTTTDTLRSSEDSLKINLQTQSQQLLIQAVENSDLNKRLQESERAKEIFDKDNSALRESLIELQENLDKSVLAKEAAEKRAAEKEDETAAALKEVSRIQAEKDAALQAQRDAEAATTLIAKEKADLEAAKRVALDDVAAKDDEINAVNIARQLAEKERIEAVRGRLEANIEKDAALKTQRDAEEEVIRATGRINILNTRAVDAQTSLQEVTIERNVALADALNKENQRAVEEAARRAAEAREIVANNARLVAVANEAAERLAKNQALADVMRVGVLRAVREAERDAALLDVARVDGLRAAREAERDARTIERDNYRAERDAARIDAANKDRLRLDAERLKTSEETDKNNALARLTASQRNLLDLQKSSSHEVSVARSQRDKALEDIERLQRRLEKQSSAPEHKIIREFEKSFQPNYSKASDLLFGEKTEKERKVEIDYYRNHRHKIYQDDSTKLAHTKIDLSEASDEEVIREIAKDRERAIKNSLPKLVAKLIGQKNKESVIEKLSRTDIVIALSVGNNQEFDQWKKENPDANIASTFFGKLEKGSEAQEIRSKAIENLLEGIKGYAAFFGVDDAKVLEPNMRPNTSPQFITKEELNLSKKFRNKTLNNARAA